MDKQSNVKTLVLALGLLSLSGLAQAEFVSGMSQKQVATEIAAQLQNRVSLDQIAKEANEAGLNLVQVTEFLILAGQRPDAVVMAVISVNPAVAESVAVAAVAAAPNRAEVIAKAAIAAAPSQSKVITIAMLTVPGVNPADVLSSTGAGTAAASAKALERGREDGRKHDGHVPPAGGGGHAYGHCKNDAEECASPS